MRKRDLRRCVLHCIVTHLQPWCGVMIPPTEFVKRGHAALEKYRRLVAEAVAGKAPAADVSDLVSAMLAEVLGYARHEASSITSGVRVVSWELATDGVRGLVAVAPVQGDFSESLLARLNAQSVNVGADWVVLTDGRWCRAHRGDPAGVAWE